MSDATSIDSLRQRCAHLKEIDAARSTLLDDMLRRLDDMQKTMDRNAFVVVLIDGDCMNFLNELIERGVGGGDEAAKLLRRAVFDYLRHDEHFKHDHKIVIRVYANFRGLAKTYVDKRVLPNATMFSDFVLGFNKAHPLCDFIDAGNHKEAADTKLKENISINMYNVHCKQIIFGASADNGYASFLSSAFIDTDVATRLRLLKGPPFSSEFKIVLPKFKWTEFKHIFRSEFITYEPRSPEVRSTETVQASAVAQETIATAPTLKSLDQKQLANPAELDIRGVVDSHEALEKATTLYASTKYGASRSMQASSDENDQWSVSSVRSSLPASVVPSQADRKPTEADITTALIDSTNERLRYSPTALDFGTVRQMVELKMGLSSNIWSDSGRAMRFLDSKNVIKYAVENWVEQTNNPPPKNATWMLDYFNNASSPSSVMKNPASKAWRAELKLENCSSSPLLQHISGSVPVQVNSKGQRIDAPSELSLGQKIKISQQLRQRQPPLCNAHHINRSCPNLYCPRDHQSHLTSDQHHALVYYSQSQRCPQGPACRNSRCVKGHMCPHGTPCIHSGKCWFADLHGMDTRIVGHA